VVVSFSGLSLGFLNMDPIMVLMATHFINFFSLAFLAAWSMMRSVAVHDRLSDELLTVN